MAGLFDFTTAQELLDQRRKNTQDNLLAIKAIEAKQRTAPLSGYAKFGGMLGELAGEGLKDYLGIKDEQEQLIEYRDMGETIQAMEKAGVGTERSGYGAGVLEQAQAEQQRRLGLLPYEVQQPLKLEQSLKPIEGETKAGFYNRIAKSFNDAGFTKNALQALVLGQEAQAEEVEEKKKSQARKVFFEVVSKQHPDLASLEDTGITVAEVQKIVEDRGKSSSDQSAAAKKMKDLIAQGVPKDKAFEIAYETKKIFTDPITGALTEVDRIGSVPPITIAPGNKEFIRIDNGVTDLSSALTRADILANKPVWRQIKENIIDKGKDIPGLGFIESKIPGFANAPEAVINKQLIAQLQNITLKNRSGASVSSPEFERLKAELATGSFNSEQEKIIAINRMYEIAQAHEQGIRAGYGADVNKEFDARWNSFESPQNSLPPSGEDTSSRFKVIVGD